MNAPSASLAEEELDEPIDLTPFLALAVALLYMLMADGEIDDHESSQLQAVIGGNQDVLELAFEYVETVSIDQFIQDAPPILSNEDKLCILCNLCDCLLADGVCLQVEEDLFLKICNAFGYSQKSFSTYYSAISLKNEKTPLGPYDPNLRNDDVMTPHLALAAALLYMMAADGDIAEEEMGQLQVSIGEFEGLQASAMAYVRKVKMSQFCIQAHAALNADQKLLILANVCDSMMSDGEVAEVEKELFENMLQAFDMTERQFSPYYAPLEIKNFKPFGTDEEVKSLHTRKSTRRKGRGETFGSQLSHKHSNAGNGRREVNDASQQGEWQSTESKGSLSDIVTRTMQENIQQVGANFENKDDIDRVTLNAVGKSNIQALPEAGSAANLQNIEEAGRLSNVQKIGANGFQIHRQPLSEGGFADNRQGIDFSGVVTGTPKLVSENRLNDLQVNIGQIHEKLDRMNPTKAYEKNNFGFVEPVSTVIAQIPVEAIDSKKTPLPNDWPELNFQAVEIPKFIRSERKPQASITELPEEPAPPVAITVVSPDSAESTMSSVAVGSTPKVRSASPPFLVLAAAVVILPMGVYGYGQVYPSLICQGQVLESRFWTTEGDANSTSLTQENRLAESHRIEIRRGEVYLDNHRFPLYKELNKDNHFAAQTPVGFHGSYTTHAVENMSYAFEFNTRSQSLQVFTQSSGVRFIDGDVGQTKVIAVFTGQCEKPWL